MVFELGVNNSKKNLQSMYDDGKTFTSNLFYCILFNSDRIFFVCPLMLSRVSLEFKIQFEVFCSSRCCKFFRLGIHNQNHCVNIVLMLLITTGTIPKLFFEIPASYQENYNSKKNFNGVFKSSK